MRSMNVNRILSGVPAHAVVPALNTHRNTTIWENILRVVYTQTHGSAKTSPALGFKVKNLSMTSTDCAQGEVMVSEQ